MVSTLISFFFLSAVKNSSLTSVRIPQFHVILNLQGLHQQSQGNSSIFWEAALQWPGREQFQRLILSLPGVYQGSYQCRIVRLKNQSLWVGLQWQNC